MENREAVRSAGVYLSPCMLPERAELDRFQEAIHRVAPYLATADCELFLPHLRRESVEAKGLLLKPGGICRSLGFVLSGVLRTFYEADGKETNTRFTLPGGFAGEFGSFLGQYPSRYAIEALEPVELVTFGFDALRGAYEASHAWERFGRLAAEGAYSLSNRRVESFLFLDGQERYLQALREEPEIFERVPLYHIASYLGLERESLSRIRRKLARRGTESGPKVSAKPAIVT